MGEQISNFTVTIHQTTKKNPETTKIEQENIPVARAEPAVVFASIVGGHAAKMSANANHDDELGFKATLLVGLQITKLIGQNRSLCLSLVSRSRRVHDQEGERGVESLARR